MKIKKGNKVAILFGASGLVGSHCLGALIASEAYVKIKIFTRKRLDIKLQKIEQHVINFENLVNEAWPYMNGDDLFMCLGSTIKKAGSQEAFYRVDFKYVILAAEMAHRRGVSQLMLVSSVGANSESRIFYKRVKGEVEDRVLRMPFWAIHIFRPSLLLGKRQEFRLGESVAKFIGKRAKTISGDIMGKFQPIEARTVAAYMVETAQEMKAGSHLHFSHHMINHTTNG